MPGPCHEMHVLERRQLVHAPELSSIHSRRPHLIWIARAKPTPSTVLLHCEEETSWLKEKSEVHEFMMLEKAQRLSWGE
jgi:hypothetical protein